ncbi:MAG: pentapeptide repeat-containing protein [Bacteroidetes bacterium]|nr:pentapeptide repeat-containing protein [Bacteroidota bacterium]
MDKSAYQVTIENSIITAETLCNDYEECTFINCDFAELNLAEVAFFDCSFSGCNLTNVKIKHTAFKKAIFNDCKLMGIQFTDANRFLLELNFTNCILDYSSFYQLKLNKTCFLKCSLKDVDFVETDLSNASFDKSDLYAATFERTNLTNADFRTAINYNLDPSLNTVTGAKFSVLCLAGLLDKYKLKIT